MALSIFIYSGRALSSVDLVAPQASVLEHCAVGALPSHPWIYWCGSGRQAHTCCMVYTVETCFACLLSVYVQHVSRSVPRALCLAARAPAATVMQAIPQHAVHPCNSEVH